MARRSLMQELLETGEGLAGAGWGERVVMGLLPRGHGALASGALTRTVTGKEGPMWQDLEL